MIDKIGKYKLQGRIGRGGMGSVFKAYDSVLERSVALKVVSADLDADNDTRVRFFREARAAARLTHPNIVTIFDLGEADGYVFIAMELLEGEELRKLIARRAALDLADKLTLITELCDGLAYAHDQGVVHRDIKPANIFVLPDGHLKILDFGTARIWSSTASLTRRGELIGTLQYMAPERLRDSGDARSDIFSVGVVLYEFLTYRAPFAVSDMLQLVEQLREYDPPPPSRVDASLPAELDPVLERALAKDPTERFESMAEMRTALGRIHRRLVDDTDEIRAELVGRVQDMHELEARAAARVGGGLPSRRDFRVSSRMPRQLLCSMREEVQTRTAHARALLERADELEPVLERGLAALARGDSETAVAELERVVAALPEHPRAVPRLAEAREKRDEAGEPDLETTQLLVRVDPPERDAAEAPSPADDALEVPASPVAASATTDDVGRPVGHAVAAGPRRPGAAVLALALDMARPLANRRRVVAIGAAGAVLVVGIVVALIRGPDATSHREQIRAMEAMVAAARDRAASVDAATLAGAAFADAHAKVATAQRLAAEAQSAAAAAAFRGAAERYAEAERDARTKAAERGSANTARNEMLAARARGSNDAAGFAIAEARARRGDDAYGRLDFNAAAADFADATSLYTKAATPAAPAPPPPTPSRTVSGDARTDIRSTLQSYVRAIQTKDLALLRQVRGDFADDEARRWARSFEITRSRQVDLAIHDITVAGEEAQVTGRREDVLVLHDGQRISTQTRFVYKLQRQARGWILHDVAETRTAPTSRR